MTTLIIGTPDSGKSLMAENIATEQAAGGLLYYLATMIPYADEGRKRVDKHRKMREGKGFITIEWPDLIISRINSSVLDFTDSTILLECISNLVGNEMYSEQNKKCSEEELTGIVIDAVKCLAQKAKNLIIVTNEFALEDADYDEETIKYVRLVARVNAELIGLADTHLIYENGEWIGYEAD